MISNKYISIKSVIYDLLNTIDERYWNEARMLEWATKAVRKLNVINSFVTKVVEVEVCNHKATLPSDFIYLNQISYRTKPDSFELQLTLPSQGFADQLAPVPQVIPWKPMMASPNPYLDSICLDNKLIYLPNCNHEYGIDENGIITTTLKEGTILISYLAYPINSNGDSMIPDDEDLKEGILHYLLYRYWMSKFSMKEDGADSRMKFHLDMWDMYSRKIAGKLNMPDLGTLENIKSMRDRLVPRTNRYQQMFLTLNAYEQSKF